MGKPATGETHTKRTLINQNKTAEKAGNDKQAAEW